MLYNYNLKYICKLAGVFLKFSQEIDDMDVREEIKNELEWKAFGKLNAEFILFLSEMMTNIFSGIIGNEIYSIAADLQDRLAYQLTQDSINNSENIKIIELLNKIYLDLKIKLRDVDANEDQIMLDFSSKGSSSELKEELNKLLLQCENLLQVIGISLDTLENIDREVEAKISEFTEQDWHPDYFPEGHYGL